MLHSLQEKVKNLKKANYLLKTLGRMQLTMAILKPSVVNKNIWKI